MYILCKYSLVLLHEAPMLLCLHSLSDRNFVCLSRCLSVTRVLCDETKEHTADIMIPRESVITLVFCYQQRLVGDIPFQLKFAAIMTHPPLKNAKFDQYLLIMS